MRYIGSVCAPVNPSNRLYPPVHRIFLLIGIVAIPFSNPAIWLECIFFYIYLRFILCKRKEQQQKKKSGQEEGENYLTARWLKTRDCQARRITHTSEPKLKRNNQMPILEKNCYQNQCHQTKPMWEAAEKWTRWSTKRKKRMPLNVGCGSIISSILCGPANSQRLTQKHLNMRQPAQ